MGALCTDRSVRCAGSAALKPPARVPQGRTSRRDWVDLGLALLRRDGPTALTIERLTKEAERTKGSFYHHFDGIEDFVAALLDSWVETATEQIVHAVESMPPTRGRRQRLTDLAYGVDLELEAAMRRLALRDRTAASRVKSVDERREETIARIASEEFHLAEDEARVLARLLYTMFIGVAHRAPDNARSFAAPMLGLVDRWLEMERSDEGRRP
jgi:AcrR family transcriptional regulator